MKALHKQKLDRVREIEQLPIVDWVNALDNTTLNGVRGWCIPGQTVAPGVCNIRQ